jgi:hypothetical protein
VDGDSVALWMMTLSSSGVRLLYRELSISTVYEAAASPFQAYMVRP